VTLLFSLIVATAIAQVFFRYVLRSPIAWASELVIQLMIWAIWLCGPIGIYQKGHLRISFLKDRFSLRTQRILTVPLDLLTLIFFTILGIKGIEVIQSVEGMVLLSMPIPTGVMFAAAPVGATLMIFFFIPELVEDFKHLLLQRKQKMGN
jgi:TRAP-type C4-dicarboxylate transport system permease small subunit